MEECKTPAWARGILSFAHAVILHSSMPEDISRMEECNIPEWAREWAIFQRRASFKVPFVTVYSQIYTNCPNAALNCIIYAKTTCEIGNCFRPDMLIFHVVK
jgi:hypothetical protein